MPRGHVTLLGGHGGAGKSVLALTIAAHVASGRDWAGFHVTRGPAVYVSLEDAGELMRFRLRRIMETYVSVDQDEITKNLKVLDGAGGDSALAIEHHDFGAKQLLPTRLLEEVRKAAEGAVLVVIDNAPPTPMTETKTSAGKSAHSSGCWLTLRATPALRLCFSRTSTKQRQGTVAIPFTVARISADTFAIAMVCARAECAAQLHAGIQQALRDPVDALGHTLHVGAHAGIALHPEDGQDARSLFKNAEAALASAKATGERVVCYAAEMNASMAERLQLEAQLRMAIEQQQFVLYYQPRVDLRSGLVVGAEALIRWLHPSGTLYPPDRFIGLAEQTGLIVPIGEWVLESVCRQQAEWIAAGREVVPIGVNLSAVQFRRSDILEVVRAALERNGLAGKHLELELTESTAMDRPEAAAAVMSALRKLGVRLALDDFGTGFSSLAYLKRFPLSIVKLDRTFVRDITHNPDDAAIAKAVIAMAHGMGLRVVAEGVETDAQMAFLRTHGCDEIQGNLFAPALPVEDYVRRVQDGTALALAAPENLAVGTLLLVDDEPGIRAALTRLLRRDGYRILTAESGSEGLELLALHPIRVIISDQRMPGMSGTEFLEIARQLHPETIRIILSGYTDLKVVTDGVNRGAVYKFITKPWDDDQVRELVRDAFRVASDRRAALEGTPPIPAS